MEYLKVSTSVSTKNIGCNPEWHDQKIKHIFFLSKPVVPLHKCACAANCIVACALKKNRKLVREISNQKFVGTCHVHMGRVP
jgi:hypothetical protein